jgi:hypothetical protein
MRRVNKIVKKMEVGYEHWVFLVEEGLFSSIYVLGSGHYGQLGLGLDTFRVSSPTLLSELNDGLDRMIDIAWGAHSCIAYSELGLFYIWGMLNTSEYDSISYFPIIIRVPDGVTLGHINAHNREIISCDVQGELYNWDLEFRRRLEFIDRDKHIKTPEFFIRKVFLGNSMRILIDSVLSPEKSWVVEHSDIMETLIENEFTIQLHDILDDPYWLQNEKDTIFTNLRILFTREYDMDMSHFKISEYNPYVAPPRKEFKKRVVEDDDDSEEEIVTTKASVTSTDFNKKKKKLDVRPKTKGRTTKPKQLKRHDSQSISTKLKVGASTADVTEEEKSEEEKPEMLFNETSYNCVKFKTYYELDEEIPSKITIKILPQNGDDLGQIYWRVFLKEIELKSSNFGISIIKSQLHLDLEAENEKQKEIDRKIMEQRRLDKLRQKQEKELKKKQKEEERLKQQKLKEEQQSKRKEETMKRAQEAVKKAMEMREKETKLKEEERKMRKEMRWGGGFNMNKQKSKE